MKCVAISTPNSVYVLRIRKQQENSNKTYLFVFEDVAILLLSIRRSEWDRNSEKWEMEILARIKLLIDPPFHNTTGWSSMPMLSLCNFLSVLVQENFVYASGQGQLDRVKRFGTYRLCEQRRFRRACASAQSRQNLRCSLIQAVSQAKPSDRKSDPWPLWMAGHAQLKFVMTECSKT